MNNKSKELLEATVRGLSEKHQQVAEELRVKQNELENISKPNVDEKIMEIIYEQITNSIDDYTSSLDIEDFEIGLEMNYEHTVSVNSIGSSGYQNLFNSIKESIEDKINLINCSAISE